MVETEGEYRVKRTNVAPKTWEIATVGKVIPGAECIVRSINIRNT